MKRKVKLTVSLDVDVVRELRDTSRALRRATSHLVEEALVAWRRQRLQEELRRGYQAMAAENREQAEQSREAQWEVIK